MPTVSEQELMRDTVVVNYADNDTGTKNTAFSITIPEGYAMVIHDVDFGLSSGADPISNRWKWILVDDPDENSDPGHSAEKVIQSTELNLSFLTSGRNAIETFFSKDCHKTMLVVNPNLIVVQDSDANAATVMYARIWFEFIKIGAQRILELLRQQQY